MKERIFSFERKFVHLRVDPILKGISCPGKQTRNHRICFPLHELWKKKHGGVPIALKIYGISSCPPATTKWNNS